MGAKLEGYWGRGVFRWTDKLIRRLLSIKAGFSHIWLVLLTYTPVNGDSVTNNHSWRTAWLRPSEGILGVVVSGIGICLGRVAHFRINLDK